MTLEHNLNMWREKKTDWMKNIPDMRHMRWTAGSQMKSGNSRVSSWI